MKHIKVTNGSTEPYTLAKLRSDNPSVSFPEKPPAEMLADYEMFDVEVEPSPTVDQATQALTERELVQLPGGQWVHRRGVRPLTEAELTARAVDETDALETAKRRAYQNNSDGVFFEWQAGEKTQQDWVDARNAVRAFF